MFLQELISLQLVKKSFTFYEIQRFITVFTTARHLSLSWARWINSKPSHTVSLRYNLISLCNISLSKSSKRSFCLRLPNQKPRCISLLPHACHMPCHLILLHLIMLMTSGKEFKSWSSSLCSFLELFFLPLCWIQILSSSLYYRTRSAISVLKFYLE